MGRPEYGMIKLPVWVIDPDGPGAANRVATSMTDHQITG
jgi:hypothetical protein